MNSDIGLGLVAAPFVSLSVLLALLCFNLLLAVVIEWIHAAPVFLVSTIEFFGSASFLAFFAIPFGFIQFNMVGGWVLRLYLAHHSPNPAMIALLALSANSLLVGMPFVVFNASGLDGVSAFLIIFLGVGGIFAPLWGCVAALLILHRQKQRSERYV
ncbi:hypothetical protein [Tropicibacter sp. Alg240-R139]|uniref:hypothetical protein n=1 Tax=Tropicibacter sp. Alg240-R139 TaxID=2305991 RepID=UPI0013DF40C0|nr:hypothetical protein [Tropicibacter sp. Alg240-R139]